MSRPVKISVLVLVLALCGGAAAYFFMPWGSAQFTYDPKVNEEVARKLNIPVYFAVPASARASLPSRIDTTDQLIDFKHPDAAKAEGDVGLRLVIAKREGLPERLAKSGLVQTGDLLLSFRSEWGGAGPYPNVQMGVSHTGFAYVKNGKVHNLDNPMNAEYIGQTGELDSEHYTTLNLMHIIRPRDLSRSDRDNLLEWATRLAENADRVYPSQISFNDDYNAPKYRPGQPINFVKQLGQIALGQNPSGNVSMYCSEFAWSLLAMKNCDPEKSADAFKASGIPSCVKPMMTPMDATGDFVANNSRNANLGYADGPLMVIDTMKLPEAERTKLLKDVFVSNQSGLAKLSTGHRAVAQQMQPRFAPLERYYVGVKAEGGPTQEAKIIGASFNQELPDNYSPTSYLINTLLPSDNANRTMDYVATVVIE